MKMSCFRIALVYSCLAVFSQSVHAADGAEGYQLSLERPEKSGNYYEFKSEVYHSTHSIESRNGQPHDEEKITVEAMMSGTAWISDANEQGEIVEVVIYPEEYEGKVNGVELKLAPGARMYVQMKNGEIKVFSSAGHTMSPEVAQVMDLLLAFMLATDESDLSDDEMLALDERRQPGQSWQGDNEALAGSLNKAWDITAEPKQIQSLVKFVKAEKLFDEDAANLELNIELKGFTAPALTKRGLSVDQSAGSVKVQRMLPINQDSFNGKVSKQVDLSITASADPPAQGKVQVQMTTTLNTQAEYQIKK